MSRIYFQQYLFHLTLHKILLFLRSFQRMCVILCSSFRYSITCFVLAMGNCFVMLAGRASFPLDGREPSLRHTRLGCAYATKMTRLCPPNIIKLLNSVPLNTAHLVVAC